jgi:hypothetical protein
MFLSVGERNQSYNCRVVQRCGNCDVCCPPPAARYRTPREIRRHNKAGSYMAALLIMGMVVVLAFSRYIQMVMDYVQIPEPVQIYFKMNFMWMCAEAMLIPYGGYFAMRATIRTTVWVITNYSVHISACIVICVIVVSITDLMKFLIEGACNRLQNSMKDRVWCLGFLATVGISMWVFIFASVMGITIYNI